MLNIYITDKDGYESRLDSVISISLNSSINVPADDITITVPYRSDIIESADMISAFSDGVLVFKGQIDELASLCTDSKAVTKISARNLAGMMLDNEAEPLTYYNPTSNFIYKRHLEPYGITAEGLNDKVHSGLLTIEKGMSDWQVFESFCKNCYGKSLRITGSGQVLFENTNDRAKLIFGRNGIGYRSIRNIKKRCELIDKVFVKINDYGMYESRVENSNKDCRGITRKRYVNASNENTSLGTADMIIKNSNASSREVAMECIGCYVDIIGCGAVVYDDMFGVIDDMIVKSVKYSLSPNGEITSVTLGKEI